MAGDIFNFIKDPLIGAAADLIEERGKFFLVKEGNPKCYGKWGFAGGEKNKNDKTLLVTAIREPKEEAGLKVRPTHFICLSEKPHGNKHMFGVVFFAEIIGGVAAPGPEVLDVGWFSFSEVESMYYRGELRGPYVFGAIKHYLRYGKIPLRQLVLFSGDGF
jgi:8-oxo-dGTP pyrophosphatase MutT (NUDIX family)